MSRKALAAGFAGATGGLAAHVLLQSLVYDRPTSKLREHKMDTEHKTELDRSEDRYSTVIKIASWVGAILVGLLSVVAGIFMMKDGGRLPVRGLVMMPVGGYFMGMAAAVLFAPTAYLEGPGRQWVEKIGTKSITTARIVAFIFVVIAIAFFGFLLAALLTDNFKN